MSTSKHPCFPDTNIPLACLFIHLAQGYTTAQFLQDFPEVSEEQVEAALEFIVDIFMDQDEALLSKLNLEDRE